ncbi:hypothetical protein [Mycetocola tolaasinivorans]|uniref:hypothetical protein n=1 Tax=Mycetocola tolaasinivorans TaxID=76635 RepID=UPI0011C428B9|nr:hypothetical protein [Mycetocola tolaasinivorans]
MLRKTTAFGTAIALAGLIGVGLGAAVPAAAAPGEGQDFDAYAQELLSRPGIEGVAKNAQGKTVVCTSPQVSRAFSVPSGVEIKKLPEPISAYAATDIVGGAGILSRVGASAYACSIGFSAWNAAGAPAVISAGHCDTSPGAGTQTYLSQPSTDPGAGQGDEGGVWASSPFGSFAFSQFGGLGGVVGQEDANSTDIAVIDVSAGAPKPAVTDWTTAATDDLSLSTTPITAVGTVKQG